MGSAARRFEDFAFRVVPPPYPPREGEDFLFGANCKLDIRFGVHP
jgi:hypothetical protein